MSEQVVCPVPVDFVSPYQSISDGMLDNAMAPDGDSTFALLEAVIAIVAILFVVSANQCFVQRRRRLERAAKLSGQPLEACDEVLDKPQRPSPSKRKPSKQASETAERRLVRPPAGPPEESLKCSAEKASLCELVHESARIGDVNRATSTLRQLEEQFGNLPLSTYTCVIAACARCGDTVRASNWLTRVQEVGMVPSAISFNAVINAFAKRGCMKQALALTDDMKKLGVAFDTITYNTLIDAWARTGDVINAQHWMQKMLVEGVNPSVVSFGSVMRACAQAGLLEELNAWLQQADKLGIELNAICFSAIINALVKAGDLDSAHSWLSCMLARNVHAPTHCFSSLLNALLAKGDLARGFSLVEKLRLAKADFDAGIFSAVVSAGLGEGDLHAAQSWADVAGCAGFRLTRSVESALQCAGLQVPELIPRTGTLDREAPEQAQSPGVPSPAPVRNACVGRRFAGTIKEFVSGKFGYIACEGTYPIFKRDVFLCHKENKDQLAKGQRVTFTLQIDKQRGLPKARDVQVVHRSVI